MIDTQQVQLLCEEGQQLLMRTRYWEAERVLTQAEQIAWDTHDWDSLARLYMPLQEARRQRRQRCGEGVVALNLVAEGPADRVDALQVISRYPHGQLLVAGWGTLAPAAAVRALAAKNALYVETFLAAVYTAGNGKLVAIIPTEEVALPAADRSWSIDDLMRQLPAQAILLPESELPAGSQKGTTQTYAEVMALWERLAAPFLAIAEQSKEPRMRLEAYRRAIQVDYACEVAHQKLSDLARSLT